jgi:capsular exopolysaccharide synthesis family protein
MDNETISIKSLIHLMLGKLWLIILLFVVGAGAAFGYSKFVMPEEYQSYTSMYVKSSAEDTSNINLSDLNTSKSLLTTYIAVLTDDTVLEKAGDVLIAEYGEDRISSVFSVSDGHVSASSLKSCLTMASVDDTEVLKITAVTTDAEISAAVCNTMAKIAPEFIIRVVGAGSVETIGAAKVDNTAVSPNVMKNTALGGLVGIVLAAAIIFALDFFDNTVKDADLLSKKYDKAIIGEIMSFPERDKKEAENSGKDAHRLFTDKDVPFYIVESYKAMRTNIAFSLSTSERKVFAVSSSNPGEGKSTTAVNIALALAQNGGKVLLIDADMRMPVQHKIFNITNTKGFSSAIGKMNEVSESITKDVAENLDLMPSGKKPPNPSELLASEQAAKIIEELSKEYDYVVIDTPPVNVVSDAMGISNSVAGMFLVVKYGKTLNEDIEIAMKKTELAHMNMLGFVMNNICKKSNPGSYYKYSYKSKYGYYDYGYNHLPKDKNKETDKEKNAEVKA